MNAQIASAARLRQLDVDYHFFDVEVLGVRYAFHQSLEQPRDDYLRSQVAQALRALHRQMLKHFEREEDECCVWREDHNDFARDTQWKRLFEEHPSLLDRLGAIIIAVENYDWKTAWVAPSLRAFDQLVGALIDHESRENAMLQDAAPEA
jgi:hypothetical protein